MSEHRVHVSVVGLGKRSKLVLVWCEASDLAVYPATVKDAEIIAEQHQEKVKDGAH